MYFKIIVSEKEAEFSNVTPKSLSSTGSWSQGPHVFVHLCCSDMDKTWSSDENDENLLGFQGKNIHEGGDGDRIRVPLYEHQYNLHLSSASQKYHYKHKPPIPFNP